jgi:hypothetical protein
VARSRQTERPTFVFIDEYPDPQEKRRAIRSQAMRSAIAERSRKQYNIRFINKPRSKNSCSHQGDIVDRNFGYSTSSPRKASLARPEISLMIPDLTPNGYQVARTGHGFDIFLLSGVVSVRIEKELHRTKWGKWLVEVHEPLYFDVISSIHDTSPLLQSAVKCTLAQYKRAMGLEVQDSDTTVCLLYGQALQDLQAALNDDGRRLQSDVVLATAVLQLFEVRLVQFK